MTTTTTTETASPVTISYVEGYDALHCQYHGQSAPQPCYVELDCEHGTLSADYDSQIGPGVPFSVWHGRSLRWSIPALTADAANGLLDRILPLAERVMAGYTERWDGHNHVGSYTQDAADAQEEIGALCDPGGWEDSALEVWDACDWYGGIGSRASQRRGLGITAETTDAELDTIAEREEASASPRVIEGTRRYLGQLRDEAIEDAEGSDAD